MVAGHYAERSKCIVTGGPNPDELSKEGERCFPIAEEKPSTPNKKRYVSPMKWTDATKSIQKFFATPAHLGHGHTAQRAPQHMRSST